MGGSTRGRSTVAQRLRGAGLRPLWLALCGGLLAAGCVDQGPESDEPAVFDIDFLGQVNRAELTGWTTWGEGGSDGGPLTRDRVGPGHILLTDGTRIVIPPDTPAGSDCDVLTHRDPQDPAACVIAGRLTDNGPEAAWFATLAARDVASSGTDSPVAVVDGLQAVQEGAGMLALWGGEVWLRVELADQVTFGQLCVDAADEPVPAAQVALPPAPAYFTEVDLQTNRIVGIDCVGHALPPHGDHGDSD